MSDHKDAGVTQNIPLRKMLNIVGSLSIHAYVIFLCIFILAPILIVILTSFQFGQYIAYPIERFSLRWYSEALMREEWRNSLLNSLTLALQTTLLATVLGLMAALAIHYHRFPGKQILSAFLLSPLLMPQLLTGLALLYFFAEYGLSGKYTPLLIGHVIVAIPYVVRLVLSGLPNVTQNQVEAALTLGADELTALFKITLPMIGPAMRGGALFAFMSSYNNVLISIFLSTPTINPLPVKILQHLEWVADPTIAAVSTLFLFITFGVMIFLEKTVRLEIIPTGRF